MSSPNKLEAKDLITVGIFTAILAVLNLAISMLSVMPIFLPLLTILIPLIEGVPFMLFLTKVKKFGMVTIMGVLCGIINCFLGMGYFVIITGIIFGVLADLVLKLKGYGSKLMSIFGYGIFSIWIIGNYIPIVVARDSYYQTLLENGMTQEYVDAISKYVPDWSVVVLLIASVICGIIGGFIGQKVLKKHFEKAGFTE